MQDLPTKFPPTADAPAQSATALTRRGSWGLLFLVVLTLGSLTAAWLWPTDTAWHFVWVAQTVPFLYAMLMWWVSTDLVESDDGH